MNILVTEDHQQLSGVAAELVAAALAWKPNFKLCAGTGETTRRTYELLVERIQAMALSTAALRLVELSEWCGLASTDQASTDHFLHQHLVRPLKVSPDRYIGFDGAAADWDVECRLMKDWLRQYGPIDLCLLGLGLNGHLAFNEPGDSLAFSTHIAELAPTTQGHAMLDATEAAPTQALTLGMGDIMAAKQVVLLVSGRHKAAQLRRLLDRDITTQFPASMLWLHPNAICICDKAAANDLSQNQISGTFRRVVTP